MFDLEGTKNERGIILILAYIIGFTSGYIAFGYQDNYLLKQPKPSLEQTKQQIQGEQMVAEPSLTTSVPEEGSGRLRYASGVLEYVHEDGTVRALSFLQTPSLAASALLGADQQGVHTALDAYNTSPDERFAFFCEQKLDQSQCYPFVYDSTEDEIRFVREREVPFPISIDVARRVYWNEDGIVLGEFHSRQKDQPWIVSID
ncbi:MAG: hypothetical protein AAGA35_00155 [Patescibacteria group bacterium]